VARIAAAHGGRAWLDDRPGGGSRAGFSVAVAGAAGGDGEEAGGEPVSGPARP